MAQKIRRRRRTSTGTPRVRRRKSTTGVKGRRIRRRKSTGTKRRRKSTGTKRRRKSTGVKRRVRRVRRKSASGVTRRRKSTGKRRRVRRVGTLQQQRKRQQLRSARSGGGWYPGFALGWASPLVLGAVGLPIGGPLANLIGGTLWYRGATSRYQKGLADGVWWAGIWQGLGAIALVAAAAAGLGVAASLIPGIPGMGSQQP